MSQQGEFDMERIQAVDLVADSEKYIVKVKWAGLDEDETTWKPASISLRQCAEVPTK